MTSLGVWYDISQKESLEWQSRGSFFSSGSVCAAAAKFVVVAQIETFLQGKNVTLPQVRLSELVDSDLTKKSVLGETDLTRKSVLGETDFSELVSSQCSQ